MNNKNITQKSKNTIKIHFHRP